MEVYLLQARQVIRRVRWQDDEHAELALDVLHFQDLRSHLLDEPHSEYTLLVHHLHSLLLIL